MSKRDKNKTILVFNSGHLIDLNISYGLLDNQVLRATRLETVLKLRKNNI